MNLIIPSLLFNLETGRGPLMEGRVTPDLGDLDSNGGDQDESAWSMADKILREVVNSATSISIKVGSLSTDFLDRQGIRKSHHSAQAILMPVLRHIDEHHQWEADKQDFAVQTFEAIMYSIQGDLSYILIENIVHHIHEANNIKLKVESFLSTHACPADMYSIISFVGKHCDGPVKDYPHRRVRGPRWPRRP